MARFTVTNLKAQIAALNAEIKADSDYPQGTYVFSPRNGMQGVNWKDADGHYHTAGLGTSREASDELDTHFANLKHNRR